MCKTVGICLPGGGAKGHSFIGVLKVLKEAGIKIDAIASTSIGALDGGIYAYNQNIEEVEKFALGMKKMNWLKKLITDIKWFKSGVFSGNEIEKFVERVVGRTALIEDCDIPLIITATDIDKGQKVVFTKGNLVNAIRASISLPFTFVPVRLNGNNLVDGGATEGAPIDFLKTDIKILVSPFKIKPIIRMSSDDRKKSRWVGWGSTVMQKYTEATAREFCRRASKKADIVIEPDVENIEILEFWRAGEAIQAGQIAALQKIEEIKKLVSS